MATGGGGHYTRSRTLGNTVRGWIYDTAIKPLTGKWYREVLVRLPDGARLLDVGIGTAGALLENADLVREKNLRITGVDIDRDYVKRAQTQVYKKELVDHVTVLLESVYDHSAGPYDAVYFAASFMLMPDPIQALVHVNTLLAPDARVYFTQTFEDKPSRLVEKTKPLLKKLTTIDFGKVTYEQQFLDVLEHAEVNVVELTTMGRQGGRTFRLAVTQPRA